MAVHMTVTVGGVVHVAAMAIGIPPAPTIHIGTMCGVGVCPVGAPVGVPTCPACVAAVAAVVYAPAVACLMPAPVAMAA